MKTTNIDIFENNKFSKDPELQKKCCKLIYYWCKENLKESKYHENWPKLITRINDNNIYKGYYRYEKNIICIYLKNNKSLGDICETIIHEWKHYKQDTKIMDYRYEISADNFGKKYSKKCSEWVKQNIK